VALRAVRMFGTETRSVGQHRHGETMNMRTDYGLCLAEFQEEAMQIIYRKRPDLAGKSLEEIREILRAQIPANKLAGDKAAR
jgi:hypothetical protein